MKIGNGPNNALYFRANGTNGSADAAGADNGPVSELARITTAKVVARPDSGDASSREVESVDCFYKTNTTPRAKRVANNSRHMSRHRAAAGIDPVSRR